MITLYVSIYLIIIVLLNDAIRFCSKMPLSGDSCRTEICQARRSTCVSVMGVFPVWHHQTGNRAKILLLFNLFFFINNFQSAILKDHHFPQLRLFRRVLFFLLEMPVNVNQYRAAKGVFNNSSFITTKNSFYVTETNSVRKMSLPFLAINMAVLSFSSSSWSWFLFTKI